MCVLPVSFQLSLKKAAAAFGASKATMAKPDDASKSSGYIPGGISPLGHKNVLPTVVDETALMWDTIFFSGGKRGLDIEMKPGERVVSEGQIKLRPGAAVVIDPNVGLQPRATLPKE